MKNPRVLGTLEYWSHLLFCWKLISVGSCGRPATCFLGEGRGSMLACWDHFFFLVFLAVAAAARAAVGGMPAEPVNYEKVVR